MDLTTLQNFLVISDEGSFTGAAHKLHLSQPALSRQLKDLEQELGCALFSRSKTGVQLTPQGQLLQNRAHELLALANRTRQEVSGLRNVVSGDLRIGVAETPRVSLLVEAFRRLRVDHPDTRLHLNCGNSFDLENRFDRGAFDFTLLSEPVNISKYNKNVLPFRERWALLTRRDNPLARKKTVGRDDLAGEPIIISEQTSHRFNEGNAVREWLGEGHPIRIAGSYNLRFGATALVEQGVGSALVWDSGTWETNVLAIRPLDPPLVSFLALCWRKDHELSPLAAAYLDYLAATLADTTHDETSGDGENEIVATEG